MSLIPRIPVVHQMRRKVAAAAYGSTLYQWTLGGAIPERLLVVPPDPWPGDAERGRWLCQDVFCIGTAQLPLHDGDFEPRGLSPVWHDHIQSFEWLRDLRALGGDQGRRQARAIILAWIDRYETWHEQSWRPDLTGRRIAVWIALHDFFAASADEVFRTNYMASLLRQSRHLARTLPGTMCGVELLQAVRGLVYAGLALEGRENWLEQGLDILEAESTRQILNDGGHISRSPAHLQTAMQVFIDVRSALLAGQYPVPAFIQHTIDRMAQAMRFMRYSDRHYALFNGTQEGEAALMDTVQMLANAQGRVVKSLPDSGYERLSVGRSVAMMDVGRAPIWPHDGDAHAAPLAFEFIYGKERIFVSCGSHPVDPEWDEVLRGTAAHNALTLDYRNACEIRKDGHFGRRTRNVVAVREDMQGACLVDAVHDGYVPLNGISHRRRLYLSDHGHDLRGEETLTCGVGLSKPVEAIIRFHLHPRVLVSLVRGKQEALLRLPGGSGWRFSQSGGALALDNSIYLGSGHRPRKTKQIVVSVPVETDFTQIKWALQREG